MIYTVSQPQPFAENGMAPQPAIALHTRGAKSGEARASPLLYTPHDDGFIVVASKAGAARDPSWYHNIRAHPDAVEVEVDGRRVAVRPRVVEEPERSELWRRVNDNYNGYAAYEQRAGARRHGSGRGG